jgi:hypothetical protein
VADKPGLLVFVNLLGELEHDCQRAIGLANDANLSPRGVAAFALLAECLLPSNIHFDAELQQDLTRGDTEVWLDLEDGAREWLDLGNDGRRARGWFGHALEEERRAGDEAIDRVAHFAEHEEFEDGLIRGTVGPAVRDLGQDPLQQLGEAEDLVTGGVRV